MRETPVRIGSYEIVMKLAAGGMATTYIAHKRGDAFFERLVVVKQIHPWLLEDPNSSDMLREEARLGAAIQHPHVVHVEDVISSEFGVCLVMPYVESLSLGALLAAVRQANERIPPAMASRIMLDVLSGLDAAHDAKDLRGQPLEIVHRDVSPNNILVGTEGQSRMIDFGIARAASRLCQTRSGDMKGTIAYMSPEQVRRRELDRRADVFAAGAVLYEVLAGERLFDGRDEADILIGVLADDIPSIHARWPDIDPDVDTVLSRALARDRDERFPTARIFADALEAVLPPASAHDLAVFVHQFGEKEFTRRRKAIRDFVDRQAIEELPSVTHSKTPADRQLEPKKKTRHIRWVMVTSMLLATIVASILVHALSNSRTEARDAVARDALSISSAVRRIQQDTKVEERATEAIHDVAALADSSSSLGQNIMTPAKRLPTPHRHVDTIHEKVDKPHASELQANPYR